VQVHLGAHWTCAVVDLACKAIFYYDSMTVRPAARCILRGHRQPAVGSCTIELHSRSCIDMGATQPLETHLQAPDGPVMSKTRNPCSMYGKLAACPKQQSRDPVELQLQRVPCLRSISWSLSLSAQSKEPAVFQALARCTADRQPDPDITLSAYPSYLLHSGFNIVVV
jgi:hypothetical protein